ncbi:MAG: acylphosphatase [Candidatus Zixiibacteriota bacterium]
MGRLSAQVHGMVQGVGYRYFVARRARENNLTGWVKNRSDGTVEIEAVGPRDTLEEFLSYVRVGPPAARVADVGVRWFDDEPRYEGFQVRF